MAPEAPIAGALEFIFVNMKNMLAAKPERK